MQRRFMWIPLVACVVSLAASGPVIAGGRSDGARQGYARGPEGRERDSNRNGTLSRSEWRGTAAEFTRLDTNRDGVLSPYEYGVGR